ncbi:hypothetical protein [Lacrimispora brassicae]
MTKSDEMQNVCRSMTVTDRVSTMLICFHGKRGEDLYGEILNCYIDGPVQFSDIGDLMLKLDEICDWVGTPQPSMYPRFLNKKMSEQYAYRIREKNKIPEKAKAKVQIQDSKTLSSQAIRAKETLMVNIEHRQSATIQGRVMGRLTSKKYVDFRSALELMRMVREIAVRTE